MPSVAEPPDIDALYRRYSQLVSSMLSSQLPPDEVEEAVSETFTIAYAERAKLAGRTEAELVTWLSHQVFAQFQRFFNARRLRGDQPIDPALLQEMRWKLGWHERMDPRSLGDVPILWSLLEQGSSIDGPEALNEALLNRDTPRFIDQGLIADANPGNAAILSAYLYQAAQAEGLGMTIGQLLAPVSLNTLLGPDGQPLAGEEASKLQLSASAISSDVLDSLAADPELLHSLTPRQFEEFMAALFDKKGFEVTLTAASKDGGADLFVVDNSDIGSFLYVVECKKYRADRPVGVGLVRQLFGVVQSKRATAGILATTSYFTRGAKEYQRELSYQLNLHDFAAIRGWLGNQP